MDFVTFIGGIVLFAIAFSLAPMSRDDRPGLLRYLKKNADYRTEQRFRRLNTLLWSGSLLLGLTLLGISFMN